MSAASVMHSTAQQLGFGLGIAFGAVALRTAALFRGNHGLATITDFRVAFILTAILALAPLPAYWRLVPTDGAEVSGRGGVKESKALTQVVLERSDLVGEQKSG